MPGSMPRIGSSISLLPLLAALVLVLPACGLFPLGAPLEKPQVTVDSVSIRSVAFSSASGELGMRITNPNNVTVPLTGIDWELAVHGDRAVTGRVDLRQEIPAKSSAPVSTVLQIATADAMRVAPHLARGARDYRLAARLRFATPVGELSVEVTKDGTL
jgi:LEA14-like dessication related protein